MANIQPSSASHSGKRIPASKKIIHIDLTAMVDLGFILVTFFVFTSTLAQPTAMNMLTPNDADKASYNPICQSCALTLVATSNDSLWYFEGMEAKATYLLTDTKSIRQIIQAQQQKVRAKRGKDELQVIIKCAANASFKSMVKMVDECIINGVKRYYIDELSSAQVRRFNRLAYL